MEEQRTYFAKLFPINNQIIVDICYDETTSIKRKTFGYIFLKMKNKYMIKANKWAYKELKRIEKFTNHKINTENLKYFL